jgi:hypothetical protein
MNACSRLTGLLLDGCCCLYFLTWLPLLSQPHAKAGRKEDKSSIALTAGGFSVLCSVMLHS